MLRLLLIESFLDWRFLSFDFFDFLDFFGPSFLFFETSTVICSPSNSVSFASLIARSAPSGVVKSTKPYLRVLFVRVVGIRTSEISPYALNFSRSISSVIFTLSGATKMRVAIAMYFLQLTEWKFENFFPMSEKNLRPFFSLYRSPKKKEECRFKIFIK